MMHWEKPQQRLKYVAWQVQTEDVFFLYRANKSAYPRAAVWPVSEESEPGDHPAPVLEVLQQSAPRYDTPGTCHDAHVNHCDHAMNVLKIRSKCAESIF